jgi:hypothetical protein
MFRYDESNAIILNMADDMIQKLKDIVTEHVRLEGEKNSPGISAKKREDLQKRIKELVRERDQMIYGG